MFWCKCFDVVDSHQDQPASKDSTVSNQGETVKKDGGPASVDIQVTANVAEKNTSSFTPVLVKSDRRGDNRAQTLPHQTSIKRKNEGKAKVSSSSINPSPLRTSSVPNVASVAEIPPEQLAALSTSQGSNSSSTDTIKVDGLTVSTTRESDFEGRQYSFEIDKMLEQEKKELLKAKRHEMGCVLLGIYEAGKSTVVKQMKLKWAEGFSVSERNLFAFIIRGNLVKTMGNIISVLEKEDLTNENESDLRNAISIFQKEAESGNVTTPDIRDALTTLKSSKRFQTLLKQVDELNLQTSSLFFIENSDRILTEKFDPTNQDILFARSETLSITEYKFAMENSMVFKLYDVGGDRRQRTKWWSTFLFDSLNMIIYVASLVGFDRKAAEEPFINQLDESIEVFRRIYSERLLHKTPIIFLLNKKDLLQARCANGPLKLRWPDKQEEYDKFRTEFLFHSSASNSKKELTEYEIGVQFVRQQHMNAVKGVDRIGRVLFYETFATDINNMSAILSAIKYAMLRSRLAAA